jgi:hypothetical protein
MMSAEAAKQDWENDPTTPTSSAAYYHAGYPTEIDRRIERVLYSFDRANEAQRRRMLAVPLSPCRIKLLLTFVDRMAALALCEGNERYLKLGRTALQLIGTRARQSDVIPLHLLLSRTARLLDPEIG